MADLQLGAQLGAAALSGTAAPSIIGFIWRRITRNPEAEAKARKLNVEADGMVITRLEAELERLARKVDDLSRQLDGERKDCAAKMEKMQGRIRQLEQQQVSLGNFDKNIAVGPLHIAFPKPTDDKDADLMGELDRVPSRKRRK